MFAIRFGYDRTSTTGRRIRSTACNASSIVVSAPFTSTSTHLTRRLLFGFWGVCSLARFATSCLYSEVPRKGRDTTPISRAILN